MGAHQHLSKKLIDIPVSNLVNKENVSAPEPIKEDEELFDSGCTPSVVFTPSTRIGSTKVIVNQGSGSSLKRQLSIIEEVSDQFSKFSSYNLQSLRKAKEREKNMRFQNSDGLQKTQSIQMSTTQGQGSNGSSSKQAKMKRSASQNFNLPSIQQIRHGSSLQEVQNFSQIQSSSSIGNSNAREIHSFSLIDQQFEKVQKRVTTFEKCLSFSQIRSTTYRQSGVKLNEEEQQKIYKPYYMSNEQQRAKRNQIRSQKDLRERRPNKLIYF